MQTPTVGRTAPNDYHRIGVIVVSFLIFLSVFGFGTVVVIGSADTDTAAEFDTADPVAIEYFDSTSATTSDDVVATFRAESTGEGFISFDEDNLDDAIAEGLTFPDDDPLILEGEIYADGTWESTGVNFPMLNTDPESEEDGFDAETTVPDGFEGEIIPEEDRLTAEGTLHIEILATGDTFNFDVSLASEDSNGAASPQGLEGSADLGSETGTATVVDNEYLVEDETGNLLLDNELGLPITEPGLAWLELHLDLEIEETEQPKGTIEGTVTDTDGDPIEGAVVNVPSTADQVETSASGDFLIEEIDASTYDLVVSADRYQETTIQGVEVPADGTVSESITLQSTPGELELSIEGDVLTAGDRLDVAGEVTNVGGETVTETIELSAGPWTAGPDTVDIAPGETARLVLDDETSEGDGGEYTAVLTAGDQTADTEVLVQEQVEREVIATFSSENTQEGLMAFSASVREAVSEGTEFPAGISIDGNIYNDGTWESTAIDIPTVQTSADEVAVDVDVPSGLSGEIDRENNHMTGSGEFDVSTVDQEASFSFVLDVTTDDSGSLSGHADFDESSARVNLVDNEYTVDQSSGSDLVDEALGLPSDDPGDNWFALGLDLDINEDIGNVAGTVRDENGDRLEGVTVEVGDTQVETDAAGDFLIEAIEAGTYELVVDGPEITQKTTDVTVEAGTTVQESIDVTRSGGLDGAITDHDGEPVEDATLVVEATGAETTTGSDGSFEFDALPAGSQEVTVEADGFESKTTSIDIEAGTTVTQNLQLTPLTGSLEGTVVDPAGDPIENVVLEVVDEVEETESDGTFSFETLPVGTHEVIVIHEEFGETVFEVEIQADETSTEEFTVDATTGSIEGTVDSTDGDPLPGIPVTIESVDGEQSETVETDDDGEYYMPDVPAGEYVLTAGADEDSQESAEITLEAGQSLTQDFTLDIELGLQLDVTGGTVTEGGTIPIEIRAENIGGSSVDTTATLDFDGLGSSEIPIRLDPGESLSITQHLATSQGDAGEYTIELATDQQSATAELIVEEVEGEIAAVFTAESIGDSYVSFNEPTLDDAIEEATEFPDGSEGEDPIIIEGYIFSDGTWQSTATEFPMLESSGLDVAVEAPSTLTGEIDREEGYMSVDSTYDATIVLSDDPDENPTFSFEISADTEDSGSLSGSADFGGETETARLVDNDFTVPDQTGRVLADESLGLPSNNPEDNWFDLELDLDITEIDDPEAGIPTGNVTGVVEDEAGEPIAGATVNVEGAANTEAVTNADGSFEIRNIDADTHDLTAEAAEYEDETLEIDIEDGETLEQNFELEAGEPELELALDVSDVEAGSALEVTAAVANIGTATAEEDVQVTVGEDLSQTGTSIELGPQESWQQEEVIRTSEADVGSHTVVLTVGDEVLEAEVQIEEPTEFEDIEATFTATNTGEGFISFAEDNREEAIEEGLRFPENGFVIEGEIDSAGNWRIHTAEFPTLEVDEDGGGLQASVDAPAGLEGEINPEEGYMTNFGTLEATILADDEPSFQFDIDTTTEESGALTGSAMFEEERAEVTLVDNEYTVNEKTGNDFIDGALELPILDSGQNWLELDLVLEINPDGERTTGSVAGTVEAADGSAIDGATVNVQGAPQDTVTDASGNYQLENVATGTAELVVTAPEYSEQRVEVSVSEDETTTQDFTLEPGAAEFDVSIGFGDDPVEPGDTVTAEVTVTNTGDATGSETITVNFGDSEVTETVELSPGESTTISLDWDVPEEGTFTASASAADQEIAAADLSVGETAADDGIRATGQGGFIAFAEDTLDDALEEGVLFPEDDPMVITGELGEDEQSWESTAVNFPVLEVEGLDVEVSAPTGLSGEIDSEAGSMTATGELEVDVQGETFAFEIGATSGESGELSGAASFDEESGTVTLVDNEFLVEEETDDGILNEQLGLPADEAGKNWLELEFEIDMEADSTAVTDDTGDDDSDDSSPILSGIGLLGGVLGIGAALVIAFLTIGRRFVDLVDPDPDME